MSISDSGAGSASTAAATAEPEQRIAYLDKALWNRLASAGSPQEMAEFWLKLQCSMIDDVAHAVLYRCSDERGTLLPAAFWFGASDQRSNALLKTAQRAITEGKGVVSGHHTDAAGRVGHYCSSAYPFILDGKSWGAVALEVADRSEEQLRAVMRQLQWGAAWIEAKLRQQQASAGDQRRAQSIVALDLVGLLLDEQGYAASAQALVTELAVRVECDLVALGAAAEGPNRVTALSHSAEFGKQMNLSRALAAAMDEACDQKAAVLVPVGDTQDYRITLAHETLSRLLDDAVILTIPLLQRDRPVGALLFQRAHGRAFDQAGIDLCDALAAVAGPILEQKRRDDRHLLAKTGDSLRTQLQRLLGPDFIGRKIALITIALVVATFALLEDRYRISAPARIEGRVQRALVAPFDGYIATQTARAGDQVKKGEVLATLDSRDLRLEHTRWITTRAQRIAEYDQRIAEHDRAGANIAKAQIEQAEAHVALLDEQLKRTELVAAFDGIIVSGDLSQSIGAAVNRGDELFRIAPLDSYRVMLEVDEAQVLDIEPGQQGQLKVAALLDQTLPYTIKLTTPISEARDGRNFFRVEAELDSANGQLRPGMAGVAKTEIESRLLIRIWSQDLLDWIRLKLWAWWP